jgi:hypothetical protein
MKTTFTNEQINAVCSRDGITRKSALRKLGKMSAGEIRFLMTPVDPTVSVAGAKPGFASAKQHAVWEASQKANPVVVTLPASDAVKALPDVKAHAANDDTLAAASVVVPLNAGVTVEVTPKAKAPKTAPAPKPSTPAGDARKEGIRLFQLAGKPKKDQFKHVYGPMGYKWTWVARAKAVGLATAEEAAKEFQRMLAGKPGEFIKPEEPKAAKTN